jgi:hypothetical protein
LCVFTFGSNQGNAHVHWRIAPLPPGTPYEDQQGAAVGWQAGVRAVNRAYELGTTSSALLAQEMGEKALATALASRYSLNERNQSSGDTQDDQETG